MSKDLIFKSADIKAVFLNGKTAYNLFIKNYACDKKTIYLPSTSPANAAFNFEKLVDNWSVIKNYIC